MSAPNWSVNVGTYAAAADFVPALGAPLLDLLAIQPGERVLDLGCGEGSLTQRLVDAGADVIAVDTDAAMVRTTADRGIAAAVDDATTLATVPDAHVDAVLSNAVLHWVRPPEAAAASIARVLKPGGRAVLEFGGHGNVAAILVALRAALADAGGDVAAPDWYFPTPEEYRGVLAAAGLDVTDAWLMPRPTPVPAGMRTWLEMFAGGLAPALGDRMPAVLDHAVSLLEPSLRDSKGHWTADYVRLRLVARRRT